MTSGHADAGAPKSVVLVVLSSEQREARRSALGELERPGVDFVFEESPEAALDLVAQAAPALVLVGMAVGDMEGLEFLALLLKRVPGFPGKVVVLPDVGDPFPPMLQGRDPVTKKSTTTAIDVPGIGALVAEIAAANVARSPAPKPIEPIVTAAPAIASGAGAPMTAPSSTAFEPMQAAPPRRPVFVIALAAVGLLVVIGIIVAKAAAPAPVPAASSAPSAPSAPSVPSASPSEPRAPAGPTATETARVPDPLEQLTTLPLSFAKGSAEFAVTNAAELDATIDGIKRALGTSRLEVGGHTSSDGPERLNEELSLKRAANVKRYLVGKGIPEAQTVLKDYKMSAAAPSSTDESNRRVTVRVLR